MKDFKTSLANLHLFRGALWAPRIEVGKSLDLDYTVKRVRRLPNRLRFIALRKREQTGVYIVIPSVINGTYLRDDSGHASLNGPKISCLHRERCSSWHFGHGRICGTAVFLGRSRAFVEYSTVDGIESLLHTLAATTFRGLQAIATKQRLHDLIKEIEEQHPRLILCRHSRDPANQRPAMVRRRAHRTRHARITSVPETTSSSPIVRNTQRADLKRVTSLSGMAAQCERLRRRGEDARQASEANKQNYVMGLVGEGPQNMRTTYSRGVKWKHGVTPTRVRLFRVHVMR